ncbi:MFS transporter [Rothia sp. ZJ932]|uniref:MFS transporter n=1 Tax=Rothia sp. ZJ932 TaxID=2810516 RepID=UPI0019673A27|nr:MFS transporter [Rothia sp. ZJ932]QRZ60824.1 MFS transporter [Rothia sp. ZJ932]
MRAQITGASTRLSRKPRIPLLLGAQTAFNLSFYAVVPFIALVLAQKFELSATAVGMVLGIRTFAQQGMFLVGGALADYFGGRRIFLVGITVRVLGFTALALGTAVTSTIPGVALAIFVAGTVFTGLGGALFSPALNLYIAQADQQRAAEGTTAVNGRTTLFAWLNVTGEIGAVLGPLLGYSLIDHGFTLVAVVGAAVFILLWGIFWFLLPDTQQDASGDVSISTAGSTPGGVLTQSSMIFSRILAVVKNRGFTRFAALHSVDLFCYNQLYFALPLIAAAVQDSHKVLAAAFAAISVVVLVGQVPISYLSSKFSVATTLRVGYCISALGLLILGAAQWNTADTAPVFLESIGSPTLIITGALLIGAGHLLVSPQALSHVSIHTPTHAKAAYLGFIATCGGIAVLLGNFVVGSVLDIVADAFPAAQPLVWVAAALVITLAASLQRPLNHRDFDLQ